MPPQFTPATGTSDYERERAADGWQNIKMKLIPLTQGQFAKVDDEDFERLSKFKWCSSKKNSGHYAVRHIVVYMHREVMGSPVGMVIDHKNHDSLDCQKENLRACTLSQNNMNRRGAASNSKTGLRGVCWNKQKKKWQASIRAKGRNRLIGFFEDKYQASQAYKIENKKYFGEFGGLS